MTPKLLERLLEGENIALVTNAGTPGISDPGYSLTHAAVQAGVAGDVHTRAFRGHHSAHSGGFAFAQLHL
jgi:16S rRNA C1402 (ribose-2'-O) methylase RsmI